MIRIDGLIKPNDESDKALLSWLDQTFSYCEASRLPFEEYWFTSLLFLAGNQWEAFSRDVSGALGRRILPSRGLSDKCQITDNRILTYYTQIVANLTDNIPTFECSPAPPNDQQDIDAAAISSRVLRWREKVDKEEQLREREIMWLLPTGECYRRTNYDPDCCEQGDLRTEVVNPFRVLKDPRAVDGMWPPRYLIEYDARDVDEIKRDYGVEIEPEKVADKMRYFDRLALNVVAHRSAGGKEQNTSAVLKRMYVPPNNANPKGQCFVWAGNKILARHDLQGGIWPWAKHEWLPVPGRLYPMSFVELLLSDQRDLNVKRSQIAEVDKRRLRGDMVVAGQGMPKETVMDESGRKIIKLPAGTQYQWETYSQINLGEAREACNAIVGIMQEKAGTNDGMLGKFSGRDTSATEFSLVKEANLMRLGFPMRRYADNGCCDVAMQKLELIKYFYKTNRIMDLGGKDQAGAVASFRGADLRNTSDVIAVPVPHLSPAEERRARDIAGQSGLFGPWETPSHQYASRIRLRAMGLINDEDQLAKTHGSLDDIAQKAASFQNAYDELNAGKVALDIENTKQQLMQLQKPPEPPPPPQGAPPGLMAPQGAGPEAPPQEMIDPALLAQLQAGGQTGEPPAGELSPDQLAAMAGLGQ